MADKPEKPKGPIGPSLRWTPADIERESRVTADDVAKAKRLFKRKAPKRIRKLLD